MTVKEKEDDTSEIFLSKLREAKRRIRKKTGGRVQTPACEGVDRSRAMVPFLTLGAIGPRLRRRARTRVRSGVDLFPRMVGAVASTAEARERLCARWPGRREQINKLLGLLGEPHDHALPVFVHGPHVTGKSSIVRDVFTTLGRPFAYTSLVDSHTPRLLLGRHPRGASAAPRGSHGEAHAMRSPRGSGVPSRQGPARRRTRGVPRDRRGDAAPRLEGHGSPPPGADETH